MQLAGQTEQSDEFASSVLHVAVRAEQQKALHAKIKWNPAAAAEMEVDRSAVEAALAALFKDKNVAEIQWER